MFGSKIHLDMITLVLLFLLGHQLYLWGSPFFFFFLVPSYISGVHHSSSSRSPAIYIWGSLFFFFFLVSSYISGVHHCGATRGVTVSMSAFLACHQCYGAGSSLAWVLNLRAVVCGIFLSSSQGVFSGYSSFLPSFIGLMVQPIK